jgi:tetratricopeptide (TPR) repeat protein
MPIHPHDSGEAEHERRAQAALRALDAQHRKLERAGDSLGLIDLLCQRFVLLEPRGRALELQGALAEAARVAEALHAPTQGARVAEALGRAAYQEGNYLEASERWSRALDLAEESGERRVGVSARVGLGQVHYAMGAWTSGLRFHRDALARLAGLNDEYLAAKVALNIGVGHFESAQLEDAERHFAHGLAAARRGQHREFEAEAHWHLARAALSRGELQRAIADCRMALDLAGRLQHSWLEASASRTWTEIALARGDEPGAIRSTRHGLALAERIRSRPQQCQAHEQLARLLERSGDYRAALAHLWKHVELRTELDRQKPTGRSGLFAPEPGDEAELRATALLKSPSAL